MLHILDNGNKADIICEDVDVVLPRLVAPSRQHIYRLFVLCFAPSGPMSPWIPLCTHDGLRGKREIQTQPRHLPARMRRRLVD